MTDSIDELEVQLLNAVPPDAREQISHVIAEWRLQVGGADLWVGRREQAQRNEKIHKMIQDGTPIVAIAKRMGISRQQVYNIRRKKSSYLR